MMGQLTRAMTDLNNALELFKHLGLLPGVSRVLSMLGIVNLEMGDFQGALACYRQALGYYQKQKNVYSSASVLNDMAYLHYLRGEYSEAFSVFNDALVKARQSGNARVEGMILIGLADLFTDLAGYPEASDVYAQGRVIVERIKDEYLLSYIDLAEAAIARQQGDIFLVHAHLDSAGQHIQESKAEYTRGLYLLEIGLLAMVENDFIRAVATLTEANLLFAAGRQRTNEIRANCLLAAAEYANDQFEQASQRLNQTCRLAADLDGRHILVMAARQVKGTLTKMASSEGVGLPAIRLLEEVTAFEANLTRLKRKLRAQETIVAVVPPRLYVQALGQIQVRLADKPVTGPDWQTQVTRDLLYLVLNGRRGWSKEEIGEILWPESSPSQLNQRFKNTIYRLRRALNQDVILYSDGFYSFNREIDYEYDVEQFEDFLAQARKAVGVDAKIEAYQTAFRIYSGEYLPGTGGEWVLPERQRLQQAFLNTGLKLADVYMQVEKYAKALEVCQRMISVDPCLEEAYRTAMNLYAREGNRAAIAQLYRDLQTVLLEIADSPPSPQTESLYRSLVV
jgi:DNA-binding SARP family transcriptional activator/Flp pilus assembly protein TadD